jgi:hypothetical protein
MTTENEIMNDSLNILEQITYDNSIESFNYTDYEPQSQMNLDQRGSSIQIAIQADDNYLIPSKSYLVIKGQLVRNDNNNPFGVNDQITLVNNAMMYLFSEVIYSVGGTIMERITKPGQVTSMLGYLSQPDDYNTSSALKSCWSKDTTIHANSSKYVQSPAIAAGAIAAGVVTPTENENYNQGFATRRGLLMSAEPRGSFSFIIPFNHMFGFGDYNKVIYNVKHSLTLTRNSTDTLAIHRANGVADGKINLTNITWRVPYITVETQMKMNLRNIIESKQTIPVAFPARTCESIIVPETHNFSWRANVSSGIEKPRWIIVGFQTAKNRTQEQNPAVFDNLNLTNAYVSLNGVRYPGNDTVNNFPLNDYSVLYEMFDNFKKEFYGFNSFVGGTQVNFATFKTLFPIIVFDVRHQSEKIKTGVVDMKLNFTFNDVVPADTTMYSIIISDRRFQLKSDGKKLTMLSY